MSNCFNPPRLCSPPSVLHRIFFLLCFDPHHPQLLYHMSKRVWNPGKTRDVQECDGYEVVVQKCAGYGMRAQRCGVSFCIQEKWRRIPAKFWAWTFVVRRQGDWLKPIGTWPSNGLGFWVPKVRPFPEPGFHPVTNVNILTAAITHR